MTSKNKPTSPHPLQADNDGTAGSLATNEEAQMRALERIKPNCDESIYK